PAGDRDALAIRGAPTTDAHPVQAPPQLGVVVIAQEELGGAGPVEDEAQAIGVLPAGFSEGAPLEGTLGSTPGRAVDAQSETGGRPRRVHPEVDDPAPWSQLEGVLEVKPGQPSFNDRQDLTEGRGVLGHDGIALGVLPV